jgi:hypothetical protein
LFKQDGFLETARSSCDFILKDIHHTQSDQGVCFSYTPMDQSRVVNANMLGARLLSRTGSITGEKKLIRLAENAIAFSLSQQKENGSWVYGDTRIQQYIDNFHTGFVLECLSDYILFTGDGSAEPALKKGLKYYVQHFFLKDGTPKYYHNRRYPLDIHNIQSVITLSKCSWAENHDSLLDKIVRIYLEMQDPDGHFYFRKSRWVTNKVSYWRWSQGWAFLALTTFLRYLRTNKGEVP